jgi:hypothetical protein
MKNSSRAQKAAPTGGLTVNSGRSAGLLGAALTPPAYGVLMADQQVGQPGELVVQPRLNLGAAGDRFEQEADRVASQVAGGLNAPAVRGVGGPSFQRLAAAPTAGVAVPSRVEADIGAARGGGQPLPPDVRAQMEQAMGTDFGRVRVHTDARAHALSRAIEARAFTTGHDVFFSQGALQLGSNTGRELLAHELAHVVQQNGFSPEHASTTVQRTYEEVLAQEATQRAMKLFADMVLSRAQRDRLQENKNAASQKNADKKTTRALGELAKKYADKFNHAYQVLKIWYQRSSGISLTYANVESIKPAEVSPEHKYAEHFIKGAKQAYADEGKRQFERAQKQEELLLGNRREVAQDNQNRPKILDTNIWSWGVNQAFIEGGAASKAAFVLHTEIGDDARALLTYMPGEDFLEAIRPSENYPEGMHWNLWHSAAKRPTWYALELAGLLDLGYRLDDDEKTMRPPQKVGTITLGTGKAGAEAYLIEEGILKR